MTVTKPAACFPTDYASAHAWWPDVIRSEPRAAALGIVVEFGTRDMHEVMMAVQAENWLHHHGDRASEPGRAIERRMRDAFYVDEDDWKEKVCMRAKEVLDRALAGIAVFEPESTR